MRISVLTLHHSLYGLRLLNLLRRKGIGVTQIVIFAGGWKRKLKILRGSARRMGWGPGLVSAALRLKWQMGVDQTSWRGQRIERDYTRLASRVDHVSSPRSPAAVDLLRSRQPDLCLLGQSGIIPAAVLAVPKFATLNAHPGVLPEYRGMDPALWAIHEHRFDQVGSTLHVVNEGIDTGNLLKTRLHRWTGRETIANLDWFLYEDCLDLLAESCQAEWPAFLQGGVTQCAGRYYHMMPPRLLRETGVKLRHYLSQASYSHACAEVKGLN